MIKNLLRIPFLKFPSLAFCLLVLNFSQAAHAQCPQRYLDPVFRGFQAKLDIIYGGNKLGPDGSRTWLAFDIYEPKGDTAQLRPLIMFFHGGGFTNWPPITRKSPEIVELAEDLARRGYVVISSEYRLFSGDATNDKMMETAVAAALDMNAVLCYLANTLANGNPYRIDTSRFFLGGSSAGAALTLGFGLFIDDTTELSPSLRIIANKVAALDSVNYQELLQNKLCGFKAKGIITISGALFDTTVVKPKPASVLVIHGMLDGAIPFGEGNVFFSPDLPKVYGPDVYMDILRRAGISVEADIYPNGYHVPVLLPFGDNLEYAIEQLFQTGTLFIEPVMDSTKRHIASFCYNLMGRPLTNCLVSGIKQNAVSGQLNIFPNPSTGFYQVDVPQALRGKKLQVNVFDLSGRTVIEQISVSAEYIQINLKAQPAGMFLLSISVDGDPESLIYIDRLVRQ